MVGNWNQGEHRIEYTHTRHASIGVCDPIWDVLSFNKYLYVAEKRNVARSLKKDAEADEGEINGGQIIIWPWEYRIL